MAEEPIQPPDLRPADAPAEDELLLDGQEEVFARTEVERGLIEHHSLEEDTPDAPAAGAAARRETPSPPRIEPDVQMAENFRAQFNPRP